MATKIKTACNRDCPDACGIIATVEGGQIVRLQGDPDHPVTRGYLCKRTSRYLQRQYDPSRITRAQIRRNKGGKNERFETVPLETALDLVAEKMIACRDAWGPASILNYRCGGSMGMMKYVTDYFFQQFGPVTTKSGDICAGAGDWAQETDFGIQDSNDIFDLLNAKTIFLWGKNVYVSHVHLLPILKEAQAKGATIILIDPIKHRTASISDHYVPIAPSGDGALALGIARWLHDHGRLDPEAANYCDNFSEYLVLLESHGTAAWAKRAGMDVSTLHQLAEHYANGPTTILAGWGMQRRRNGAATIRAIDALAAASGNIGIPGGGISFYFQRRGAYDVPFAKTAPPRQIPEPLLGSGIEAAVDPPIKMVFVTAANPVANLPQSNTVARALRDRFTVVVDQFMTDTAETTDVVLPAATMLEDNDLLGAYGHHYLNRMVPVVEAPDDAQTDYGIIRALARRVGLAEEFDLDDSVWLNRITASLQSAGVPLESLGQEIVRSPQAAPIVFADRKFKTPSGRANLLTDYDHTLPSDSTEYPFRLMAISTDRAQASQWRGDQQDGPPPVNIHPSSSNGLHDGQLVVVASELGQLTARLSFDENQRPDIATMEKGGWLSKGRCANAITAAEMSDYGGCAVFYDTLVRINAATEDRNEI